MQHIDFFVNRVDTAVVGSQIEPAGAPRIAQSSQIDPARVPGAGRSSHSRPDGPSKGTRGSQIEPVEARSSQEVRARVARLVAKPGRPASEDEPGRPAGRPADRPGRAGPRSPGLVEEFRY